MTFDPRFIRTLWKVLILFALMPFVPLTIELSPIFGAIFGGCFCLYMIYLVIGMHRWVEARMTEYEQSRVEEEVAPEPVAEEFGSEEFYGDDPGDGLWSLETWNDENEKV